MCGILGWFEHLSEQTFLDALNLQRHRGPDDWGYQRVGQNLHLGHRRLSIIDLNPHAKQPMTAAQGRLTAVFNGEIYNYQQLRQQLTEAGYRFQTDGDTEVLINAWDYWGSDALQHFIGMFAFAIYCHRSGELVLARDRFGIKPLFIYQHNNYFGFASEVKSLLALIPNQPSLDDAAVSAYFSFRYPLINNSFFNEIVPLPPGHLLYRSADGQTTQQRYYNLSQHIPGQTEPISMAKASEQVRALVQSATELRMIADVPVGAYLSGGVDSSAVVAAMARASRSTVKTFTIGFTDDGYNEFSYARQVAERYQTEHHEILLSNTDYLNNMQRLIKLKDAPLGVPNEVPLLLMSEQLKKHVTVVLSGEGADEIFAGYGRLFRSSDDYTKLKMLYQGVLSPQSTLAKNLIQRYATRQFDTELDHFLYLYRYQDLTEHPSLFTDRLQQPDILLQQRQQFERFFDECPQTDYASKMMYCFEHLHLPGLLQRVDATTMASGVEARVPFVDHRLVEYAFSLPTNIKMAWQSTQAQLTANELTGDVVSEQFDMPKAVLKQAFERVLPHGILYRKKVGFPVPLAGQLHKPMLKLALDILPDGALVSANMINRAGVLTLLQSNQAAVSTKQAMLIWMLVNMELFLQHYFPANRGTL